MTEIDEKKITYTHADASRAFEMRETLLAFPYGSRAVLRRVKKVLDGKTPFGFVYARVGDKVVGWTSRRRLDGSNDRNISLYVHPDYRGHGIAFELLRCTLRGFAGSAHIELPEFVE